MTFEKLALRPETLRAVKELGFIEPTPIQIEAIPLLAQGVDLIGQAETGSGKTAAFGIHIIEKIDKLHRFPQALILAPTRELAVQVAAELRNLGKYHHISVVTVYGGASIDGQSEELRRGAQIVVGTPGRILDMLDRGVLRLGQVHTVVLDEADRMLDMGFIDDVKKILGKTQKIRQTLLFSATIPDEIKSLARQYMVNPESLAVSTDAVPIDKIRQSYVFVDGRNKFTVLLNLLEKERPELVLLFVKTKYGADKIARQLQYKGKKVIALHGNLSQRQRDTAMHAFRHKQVHILVATDIAARGIDVSGITHVINYDLPMDPNFYPHRVGRTARAGASGKAISLVTPEQDKEFRDIQLINGVRIPQERIIGDLGEFSGNIHQSSQRSYTPRRQYRPHNRPSYYGRHNSGGYSNYRPKP